MKAIFIHENIIHSTFSLIFDIFNVNTTHLKNSKSEILIDRIKNLIEINDVFDLFLQDLT